MGLLLWIRARVGDASGTAVREESASERLPAAPKASAAHLATGERLPRRFWLFAASAGAATAGLVTFGVISYHLTREHVVPLAGVPVVYAAAMAAAALAALVTGWLYDRWNATCCSPCP